MNNIYVVSLAQHIIIIGFFRVCKTCLKTNILGLGLSCAMYRASQPCQKKIFIYIFNCKYENISVKVIVRTNPAVCLNLIKEATVKHSPSEKRWCE